MTQPGWVELLLLQMSVTIDGHWNEVTTVATQYDDPTKAAIGQSKSQLTYVPQHPYAWQHTDYRRLAWIRST